MANFNEEFIDYLNTLHSYNAQNQNAYSERNISSPFYEKTAVRIGLGDFITNLLKTASPQMIVLTGHAGDGKTSIMYQVLKDFGLTLDPAKKQDEIVLPSGKRCLCIKDFSEFSDNEKVEVMKKAVTYPEQGNFVFMVANTGPLINTYLKLFDEPHTRESAEIALIEAMDKNTGEVSTDLPHIINIINVAAIDNTYFATAFLEKVTKEELWQGCSSCPKKDKCHIARNRRLIIANFDKVISFLEKHYIWLYEHGKRLTVRSMTEQIAYMITGGQKCDNIKKTDPIKFLFPNLFFGYKGVDSDPKAFGIFSIACAYAQHYENHRIRADEQLLIDKNYSALFTPEVATLLQDSEKYQTRSGWNEMIRRIYFFLNIVVDSTKNRIDTEDVFSPKYPKFLEIRDGKASPSKSDASFIADALSMIYIGTPTLGASTVPLTLSRKEGISQNVQFVVGEINVKKLNIIAEETKDSHFDSQRKRFRLLLKHAGEVMACELTLPMLNYFEELRKGVISTNVDPQLSHGVESLRAQLTKACAYDDEVVRMVILKNKGNEQYELDCSSGTEIEIL